MFRARRLAREQRKRSQKVVLACATFDPDGKVMMTTEGMLPCQEITDSFHERVYFFGQMESNCSPLMRALILLTPYSNGFSECLVVGNQFGI